MSLRNVSITNLPYVLYENHEKKNNEKVNQLSMKLTT